MNSSEVNLHGLDIVIFGGAGDLAYRKLIPALYMAFIHQQLPITTRIIAVGRQSWDNAQYKAFIASRSPQFIEQEGFENSQWERFQELLMYVCLDVTQAFEYKNLKHICSSKAQKIYYFATAPQLFSTICANIHNVGLIDQHSRVVLEKPLGTDLASAKAINKAVSQFFEEHQIFRIDHYLGKETVQNLMVLRFANAMFEPLWRAPYIKSVQITVAESVGVGSRVGFYDGAGAMRDMVQNHLLQLLCIVAMEQPISLNPDDIRDEKLKVLRSLRPMQLSEIAHDTVRGQYTAGQMLGQPLKGYLEEDNAPIHSRTETFVALKTYINNTRWANVPFFLRTGKRMEQRRSEIIIDFTNLPFSIFADECILQENRLVIRLQPEESIHLEMFVKEPGSGMKLRSTQLSLDLLKSSSARRAQAYERLLIDVVRGRLTHFMRSDELEAAWSWVEPIINGWKLLNDEPKSYAAGTWGPVEATALLARQNMQWFEEL